MILLPNAFSDAYNNAYRLLREKEIDDNLIMEAMKAVKVKTKRKAIEIGLRELVAEIAKKRQRVVMMNHIL